MTDLPMYSIGSLARMLGIPPATLRTWEVRYEVVVPGRSQAGHRLYSRRQVAQLRFVADQVATGLSPGDAHRMLQGRMTAGGPLEDTVAERGNGELILLAERDPYAADFSEFYLRREGYEVVAAPSADQARVETLRNPPQLAVIDLLISSGQGLRLCAQLADQLDLPVVAVSTFAQADDALAAGAGAFLRKPLQGQRLVSVVRELLGRPARLTAKQV